MPSPGCYRRASVPNLLTRCLFFLSSYSPLLIIGALRYLRGYRWASSALIALAVLLVFVLPLYLRLVGRISSHPVVVSAAAPRDGESMSYVATYLLPFLSFSLHDRLDAISV